MLAKEHRFSFKNGAPKGFFQTPFFVIRHDNNAKKDSELAVVVGKKVDKRATVRNRIKRSLVSEIKDFILGTEKLRIVVYAKKSVNEENLKTVKEDLLEAFKKLK